MRAQVFKPTLGRQADDSEFKDSLVYVASSRTARTTQLHTEKPSRMGGYNNDVIISACIPECTKARRVWPCLS